MAISRDDVRHIAGLARIGIPDEQLDGFARDLTGILAHMDVLQRVESAGAATAAQDAHAGMPLRSDEPPPVALEHSRESIAPKTIARGGDVIPAMMDGFYLVPRLATHEDAGDES